MPRRHMLAQVCAQCYRARIRVWAVRRRPATLRQFPLTPCVVVVVTFCRGMSGDSALCFRTQTLPRHRGDKRLMMPLRRASRLRAASPPPRIWADLDNGFDLPGHDLHGRGRRSTREHTLSEVVSICAGLASSQCIAWLRRGGGGGVSPATCRCHCPRAPRLPVVNARAVALAHNLRRRPGADPH